MYSPANAKSQTPFHTCGASCGLASVHFSQAEYYASCCGHQHTGRLFRITFPDAGLAANNSNEMPVFFSPPESPALTCSWPDAFPVDRSHRYEAGGPNLIADKRDFELEGKRASLQRFSTKLGPLHASKNVVDDADANADTGHAIRQPMTIFTQRGVLPIAPVARNRSVVGNGRRTACHRRVSGVGVVKGASGLLFADGRQLATM